LKPVRRWDIALVELGWGMCVSLMFLVGYLVFRLTNPNINFWFGAVFVATTLLLTLGRFSFQLWLMKVEARAEGQASTKVQ
jgi:hypothetical protein